MPTDKPQVAPDTAEMRRLAEEARVYLVDHHAQRGWTELLRSLRLAAITAADALDAERAARKSDRQTANATAKKWSEEWRDEYARVKDLQRQIDEAPQLDGGCSTLAELINAVTKLKFDHAETEKALSRVQYHLSYSATEANALRAANARLEKALREVRAAYVSGGLQPTLTLIDAALSKRGSEEQD